MRNTVIFGYILYDLGLGLIEVNVGFKVLYGGGLFGFKVKYLIKYFLRLKWNR